MNDGILGIERRSEELLAPLPTLGDFANDRIVPELTLNARIGYLSLTAGDYRGRLVNAQIAAVCRLSRNIGVGPAAILQVGF